MNTIKPPQYHAQQMKLCELLSTARNGCKETAFIGRIGDGRWFSGLFLICYKKIILAELPSTTWSLDGGSDVLVYVDRFVDIKITVVEKKGAPTK